MLVPLNNCLRRQGASKQWRLTKVSFSIVLGIDFPGYLCFRPILAGNISLLLQRKWLKHICGGKYILSADHSSKFVDGRPGRVDLLWLEPPVLYWCLHWRGFPRGCKQLRGAWRGSKIAVWNLLSDVSVIQMGATHGVQTQASWRESRCDPADRVSTGTFKIRHIFQVLCKTKIHRGDFPECERN